MVVSLLTWVWCNGCALCAGLNVTWNEVVAFKIRVPQLAQVSFLVKDSADNLLAQYTLPMRCMTEGKSLPMQFHT